MRSDKGNVLESVARLGYGARGVVYCLVGGLAVLAAFGRGGQTSGSRGALQTVLDQPFGWVLLGVIALGLAGFAAWRLVSAIVDADRHGTSRKGLAIRAGHAISAVTYGALALSSLGLALGRSRGGSEDQSAQDWTAWLFDKPLGQWIVGLIGLVVVGVGLAFLRKGWRGTVTDHLAVSGDVRRWAVRLGRLGYAARGVVFVLIGGFLVLAALHSNSSEVKGLGSALQTLQGQPYGRVLLGLTAAGLFAFGVFGFVQARYRRIEAPDLDDIGDAAGRGLRQAVGP